MKVSLTIAVLAAGPVVLAHPAILTKRIAQTIADSTAPWVQACVSLTLITTLHRTESS